ncbi:uncharacterized protein LOC124128684 [Haliotis rufescens]|uniref:uncharacterized protein LOC124128684 n=1 Tax=Haliotis rufescens TaxID=6454 RepID=UPI00201F3A2B|nr:uncharacterized protein LOC124128684 [Haliotis rufescens]
MVLKCQTRRGFGTQTSDTRSVAMDLLTPEHVPYSNWTILSGLLFHLGLGLWQLSQERFLPSDSVELATFDITVSTYAIYHSGLSILRLCIAGVVAFVKRYGLKKVLLYLSFISALSCVIVSGLDFTSINMARVLQKKILGRISDSVVEIDEMRGPIKFRHMTDSIPFSVEEHTKYPGEEVVFECYRHQRYSAEVLPWPDQVVWEKDGKPLHTSDHINITWTFENVTAGEDGEQHTDYLISSKLTIIFIDQTDFGNYSCKVKDNAIVIHITLPKPKPPMCPLEPPPPCMCFCLCEPPPPPKPILRLTGKKQQQNNEFQKVKVFSLVQMKELTRVVHAPPGGLVSFTATFDHLGEIDDVSFNYTIGGDPFDTVCGGLYTGCSKIVLFYWMFWHNGGHNDLFTWRAGSVRMRNSVTGTGWQCVCKKTYNYHEFAFFRTVYNASLGREEIREVKYPHRILLSPRTPDLFFVNFTNTPDPIAKEPCWIRPKKQLLHNYCENDEAGLDWIMWILIEFEFPFMLSTFLIMFISVMFVAKLTSTRFVIPVRNRILEGSFYPCRRCVKTAETLGCFQGEGGEAPKYDVFVSHPRHGEVAGQQLTTVLESAGNQVFLPCRDILIGQPIIPAMVNAINTSRLFLVMVTQEYIQNGFNHRFELQHILLTGSRRERLSKRLLLILCDDCFVPEPFEGCPMIEWKTNDRLDENKQQLRNWSKGKGCFCDTDSSCVVS